MTQNNQGSKPVPSVGKKPYETPQLTEYGPIAKLTQGRAGSGKDSHRRKR
ncbi:MAG: lasso RiPP family leader peptide-containing protein [Nitrospira sp.]|nr:lasso RiPP family leader peptide-containing protein [Nitrospira sp.]